MLEALRHYVFALIQSLFTRCSLTMATDTQMTGTDDDRICLPGFGLDLMHLPDWNRSDEEWNRFPHAIADALASNGVTIRERRMLEFISQITDVGLKLKSRLKSKCLLTSTTEARMGAKSL